MLLLVGCGKDSQPPVDIDATAATPTNGATPTSGATAAPSLSSASAASISAMSAAFTMFEGDDLLRDPRDADIRSTTSSQFGDGAAFFSYPQAYQFNGGRTVTMGIRARF